MNLKLENARIAILGLGYVGLPLAVEFGKQYHTLGSDRNADKISELESGCDRIEELGLEDLRSASHLKFTSSLRY